MSLNCFKGEKMDKAKRSERESCTSFKSQIGIPTQCDNCYKDLSLHAPKRTIVKQTVRPTVLNIHETTKPYKSVPSSPIAPRRYRVNLNPLDREGTKERTVGIVTGRNEASSNRKKNVSFSTPVTPSYSRRTSPDRSSILEMPSYSRKTPIYYPSLKNKDRSRKSSVSSSSSRCASPMECDIAASSLPRNFSSTRTERLKRQFILNNFKLQTEEDGVVSTMKRRLSEKMNQGGNDPYPLRNKSKEENSKRERNEEAFYLVREILEELMYDAIKRGSIRNKSENGMKKCGIDEIKIATTKELESILLKCASTSFVPRRESVTRSKKSIEKKPKDTKNKMIWRQQKNTMEGLRLEAEELKDRVRQLEELDGAILEDKDLGQLQVGYLKHEIEELETKLMDSDARCFDLLEENVFLKAEIDCLINEAQDTFRQKDAMEWRKLKVELDMISKNCRNYQLKLRRAQLKTADLKAKNDELMISQLQGQTGMVRNVVIGLACLIAGYQIISRWKSS